MKEMRNINQKSSKKLFQNSQKVLKFTLKILNFTIKIKI